jgi:hypothetical protein
MIANAPSEHAGHFDCRRNKHRRVPQNPGYNPTGTVAALTYRAAEAIKSRYLKSPGALVQA